MNKQQELRDELKGLQAKLQDPNIYSDPSYPKIAKRISDIEKILELFDKKTSLDNAIVEAKKMVENESGELADMAKEELEESTKLLEKTEADLDEALIPKDPNDDRDAIIEIRSAAGGDEASLFAGDLYRMYTRWAEIHNFKIELISQSPSEAGGYKEVIFEIQGVEAYKNLKFEAGVHRVQRVPSTESQGRVHTSTVTVAVLPEAEEEDVEIRAQDLKIDTYRASGHGGQSVNTTDSAVRITHLPTGVVVTQQDEKSQLKNKAKAMGVLRSRLLQKKIEDEQQQLSDARKKLIGTGDRSEKIRTYNFPQDRITDHRIGYSRSNIPVALDGQIDDLIENLQTYEHELLSQDK
ncbi:MAG: peptide chain release factor 1 [bacterium]|nr:peptide chain release factor 1 [bacterium]